MVILLSNIELCKLLNKLDKWKKRKISKKLSLCFLFSYLDKQICSFHKIQIKT